MLQDLYTVQGARISDTPWQSYPRPQLKRESYWNLNGRWDFAVSENPDLPENYDQTILVPFCPESLLSGTLSAHTVCQIPETGVYHIPPRCMVCLP